MDQDWDFYFRPDKNSDLFGVQIFRKYIPGLNRIDEISLPIFELVWKFSGEYDGWETAVFT